MRYRYNKENLILTLNELKEWAERLDVKQNKELIETFWDQLDLAMNSTQQTHYDCFGTEGYEVTIMGNE